jgi:hypothetical protein
MQGLVERASQRAPQSVDQRFDGRHRRVRRLDLGLGRHRLHDRGQHVLVGQLAGVE